MRCAAGSAFSKRSSWAPRGYRVVAGTLIVLRDVPASVHAQARRPALSVEALRTRIEGVWALSEHGQIVRVWRRIGRP